MFDNNVGKIFWFEYHCFESHLSQDAELWYHSHQKVTVVNVVEWGEGDSPKERAENGVPRVYKGIFLDGKEFDVFEDELYNDPLQFERPDPPKR